VLLEPVVSMRVIVYTSPRSPNEAEMDQLNYTPCEMQAEAASGAVQGNALWKGWMGLRQVSYENPVKRGKTGKWRTKAAQRKSFGSKKTILRDRINEERTSVLSSRHSKQGKTVGGERRVKNDKFPTRTHGNPW